MSWQQTNFDPSKHSIFVPINKEKYIGDKNPVCRSEWERRFCVWCDRNKNILLWSSEPFPISYFDVVRQKQRQYYPDFLIKTQLKDGTSQTWLVEVKPKKETIQPKKSKRKTHERYILEAQKFATNISKWKAATNFAKSKGWKFKLITEEHLF